MSSPMNYDPSTETLTISNVNITFNSAMDPSTGTATITITPAAGAFGTMPAVLQGPPGPAPVINITTETLAPGSSATSSTTQTGQGSYQVGLGIPQGAQGDTGPSTNVGSAPDVGGNAPGTSASSNPPTPAGTPPTLPPPANPPPNGWTLAWNDASNLFNYVPQAITNLFTAPSPQPQQTTGSSRVLTVIDVAAQTMPWWPMVSGQVVMNGTPNTQITVTANLNAANGPQVGLGYGVGGNNSFTVGIMSWVPGGVGAVTVPAGTDAQIYFVASLTSATADPWGQSSDTPAFSVFTMPTDPLQILQGKTVT